MTDYQPLNSAEEVQRAFAEGRDVECSGPDAWARIETFIGAGPVARLISRGYQYRTPKDAPTPEAERPALVSGEDGMLPDALVPHAKEWYRLCERRFAVEKITISGELAEAIVEAICQRAPTPNAIRGDKRAEAVQAEVVGKVRQRRGVHGDFDGFDVDWLLEGGIHAVGIDGDTYLYVLDIPVPEDGHIELFAPTQAAAKEEANNAV